MKHFYSFLFFLVLSIPLFSQSDIAKVKETITQNEIEGHIYFLASDLLKGRATGSAENKIAAQYLSSMFRSYGVATATALKDSYLQPVPLTKITKPSLTNFSVGAINTSEFVSVTRKNLSFDGDMTFMNYGLDKDYGKEIVTGKIVIAIAGSADKTDPRSAFSMLKKKRELAQSKGAIGLIEIMDTDTTTWKNLSHYLNRDKLTLDTHEKEDFVHGWIRFDSKVVRDDFKKNTLRKGTLTIKGITKKIVHSQNVVGIVEGTDPILKNEYIIYSAHYDHVGIGEPVDNDSIYNGARDNAVGSVTVLAAAKNIAKYPTKRSALFILFTGEEKGLLGSQYYVQHPVLPLHQMVYCFNSDNGGYNDTTLTTIIGLERTTAAQDIKEAALAFGLKAIDDPAPEQGLFDRSDNVHFASKGIPAPTFSMGFTAFDKEITKYYHQVTDNPDTLDYPYLFKFFQSYVLASRKIANNPKTPFWIKGDKYYNAGIELYKK
ncbi:M28 family peptidase [Aquimarina sp. W85]|uniref:M28 family peptidase n=1 Tax=Aquimarina rhodophyticola TaxID=3342246 RepID=UPI0036734818